MGTSMKMVVNLLLGNAMAAFAEAMALGEGLGISPKMLFDSLLGTPAVAPFIAAKRAPHAGILRLVATTPSCNQQALAKRLGVLPSRMVVLIDELTERGMVERKRSTKDRRHSELILTAQGKRTMEKLARLAAEHEADLCAGLTAKERDLLAALGRKIVHQQGLTPDVHPGYRKLFDHAGCIHPGNQRKLVAD